MSYEYLIGIRLATPDSSIQLNQEPFSSAIFSAIEEYNSRSELAPNPKNISLKSDNFLKIHSSLHQQVKKNLLQQAKLYEFFHK